MYGRFWVITEGHNATRLLQEIRHRGYTGCRSMVAKFVAGWRQTGQAVNQSELT